MEIYSFLFLILITQISLPDSGLGLNQGTFFIRSRSRSRDRSDRKKSRRDRGERREGETGTPEKDGAPQIKVTIPFFHT